MLHYIKGVVTETFPQMIVIECAGIGYEVNVPDGCPAMLSAGTGEPITVYTAMMVREDDVSLYGFSDRESLALFRLLLTVNGVGAKAALAMLSALSAPELKRAIAFEDAASITRANGVGKKIAQRVVLELKDKVQAIGGLDMQAPQPGSSVKAGSNKDKAVQALVALGFSRTEALAALAAVSSEDLTTEEYIRQALKQR